MGYGKAATWRGAAGGLRAAGASPGSESAGYCAHGAVRDSIAPPGHKRNSELSDVVTLFRAGVNELKPDASGGDLAKLLDGKAKLRAAQHWLAGRREPPKWAVDIIAQKLKARAQKPLAIACELEAMPERIGRKAGARNLAEYLARRR